MKQSVSPIVAVVDDDAHVRRSLANLFRSVGMRVETHGSAEEFLASYQDSSPASTSPSVACLVLDLRLPGMSGLDLVHRLRAAGSSLPIVILSAQSDGPVVQRCLLAGAIACLAKPFVAHELLRTVNECLEQYDQR